MDFKTLHANLPYVVGGKKHILEHSPYNAVTLYFPGRHALDTDPIGGDFVVTVDDEDLGWIKHQFTHNDIFGDLQKKVDADEKATAVLMQEYLRIVKGGDPNKGGPVFFYPLENFGLNPTTFIYAVQCLAVAEHRRYAKFEPKGGGRYLPARFAAGIVAGVWDATDCANMARKGRPGVEILEKAHQYDTLELIK
jgi:hypothetical protein